MHSTLFITVAFIKLCTAFPPADSSAEMERESYRAHLAAALASSRLGEPGEARKWLDDAPIDQRGWEWFSLDNLFDQSKLASPKLPDSVFSIAINRRATKAALALTGGPILLWDLKKNAKILELPGHPGGSFCVRFSPDETRLVSSGVDRIARIWDLESKSQLLEFKEHKFPVPAVTFADDGKFVASAAYYTDKDTPIEGRVHLWNATTGEIVRTFKGGVKPISSLAISPDHKLIAAGSWDSCVLVWDFESGGDPRRFGGMDVERQNVRISSISFSPDGKLLAAGSDHDWAKIYRVDNGEEITTLTDHKSDVNTVAFSSDGKVLATGGDDGAIRLWNTTDWSTKATLCGHTGPISSLAWSKNSRTLVSGSHDKSLRVWDARRKDYGGLHTSIGTTNYSVNFSPDGKLLACSSSKGTIGLVNSHTGEIMAQWIAHPESAICTATISPDGKRIASCSWDKTVGIFDIETHKELSRIELPAGVAYIAWSPSGEQLAAALTNATAVLIYAQKGEIVRTLSGHTRNVHSVGFSPDGKKLTTASADKTGRIWNAETGEALAELQGHNAKLETSAYMPDGLHVVTGSDDGSVKLWNATNGQLIRTLMDGSDPIYRVTASPDGKRIAAAGKYLYILDPLHPGALLKSKPLTDTLWHIAWSPDGERLAATSWDGKIVILAAGENKSNNR